MPTIILVPFIMVVTIGSVIGIRGLYRHSANGSGTTTIDDMTRNVEERTKHIDEHTRNL